MPKSLDPRTYTYELIAGTLRPTVGQRILALGIGAELVLSFARAVGSTGRVDAITTWLPDWRRLTTERERSGISWVATYFAANLDILGDRQYDTVAVDIAAFASARSLLAMVVAAAERLVPDGILYAAGSKDQGIISFGRRLEELMGNALPLAYRKGQRVLAAHRISPLHLPDLTELFAPYDATLHGITLHLARDPAVFARGEVDDATAMLAEAIELRPDDVVLDPGCGAGILGLLAARLVPQGRVVMTDAEAAAIDLSRANAARNGITNIQIIAADIVDMLPDERFSVVVCNPPFHERHEQVAGLAERFLQAAFTQLLPEGRLYFVANRFLAYESRISAIFGQVTEVAGDARYKVLLAIKQKAL